MNDITELRTHLFDTLRGLKDTVNPMDIDRAKAVSDVAKTIIDSARVEVDLIKHVGGNGTGFIQVDGATARPTITKDKNGTTTTVQLPGMAATLTRHVAR